MLFRRRASHLSASDFHRCVCDVVAVNRLYAAVGHRDRKHVASLLRSLPLRAMHTTPPRPTPATFPSSTCKWKRGRPIPARSSIDRQLHHTPALRAQSLPGQSTQTNTAPLVVEQRHIRQVSTPQHVGPHQVAAVTRIDEGQRLGLWTPVQGLRFAPSASTEAHHSTSTASDLETMPRPKGVDTSDTPETPKIRQADVSSERGDDAEVVEHSETFGRIPLTYQIPEEKLRAAMLASPETRASYWSAKLYQGPNGESLSTHYCKSMEVADRVAQYFLEEKVVGFDIEWKPRGNPHSIKQNASLIQLACEDRIALFHISLFSGTKAEQLMPPNLKAVLESPDIYKVGVAVKGDFTRLEKYLGIQAQGIFELSRLHNLVEWYKVDPSKVSNKLVGLAAQVHQHLQLPLYKGGQLVDDPEITSSVRESDWSLPLDLQQIHYAAADAYAGFRLYHTLELKRTRLSPTPPAVRLCDYDNKPVPRSKEARKRVKAVSKSKDALETSPKQTVDVVEEKKEGVEGAEGYETAPEELDSHRLEDPVSATSSKVSGHGEEVTLGAHDASKFKQETDNDPEHRSRAPPEHKRVGRVSLSWLKGPDPGYPTLPQVSAEETERPLSTPLFKHSSAVPTEDPEDDEFADPELEEALQRMDIDRDGKLRDDVEGAALEHEAAAGHVAHILPLAAVAEDDMHAHNPHELASAQVPSTTNVVELSDFNPITLDSQELDEPSTPTFTPLASPSEETPRAPDYDLATTWAQEYLHSTVPLPTSAAPSRIRATVPHLRAYHLWYHQKLSVDEIAQHLGDPPLSHSTVTSYVLQAIALEKLEYDKESLKDAMMLMPSGMRKGRWKWLAEKASALD
ncbi:hypothetical protein EJ02DRAFT_463271 [Clathrospora elynae]|uniref:3'-5' exonuclease domain-containing protein n=1 Tax=Clathrospora elynae TaxID=706981 RepID=A0A6A5SZS9_9PLEO|nr:hypothetical protein EJ02DRAFT_463271 [Clathrospora elynae]